MGHAHAVDAHASHLPDLRFVPTAAILPHEQPDGQRLEALAKRLREQSVLKNPPIVTPLSHARGAPERYVVLDGANRATAAQAAGFPHMLVQIVRYAEPDVRLTTWNHALALYPHQDLLQALQGVPGLEVQDTDPLHARAMLARRDALAWMQFDDGAVQVLLGGRDIHEANALLNIVVDGYREHGRMYRVELDAFEPVRTRHPDVTALVVFPHFEPAEILELAQAGDRLPAGITRHLVRWRALRLNVPIELLADATRSREQKGAWLDDWIRDKLATRQVRYYEEATVLFDE